MMQQRNWCAGVIGAMILSVPFPVAGQGDGPETAFVSQKGFDCFVRHMGSYLEQGQEIVVNFEDCPSQPGLMERMEAREATNLLPGAGIRRQQTQAQYQKFLILTPEVALCLRKSALTIKAEGTGDLVALVPAECLP